VHPDVSYFSLQTPENNPGWRTKWFYAKDKSSDSKTFGLEEFQTTSILQPECPGDMIFRRRR
jgi:hypothetical protein